MEGGPERAGFERASGGKLGTVNFIPKFYCQRGILVTEVTWESAGTYTLRRCHSDVSTEDGS